MPFIVTAEVEAYAEAHTTPPPPHLVALAGETQAAMDSPGMMVGPLEGRFLEFLVRMTGAGRILEIGTFTGYSSLSMAEGLAPGGSIVTCELNPAHAEMARRHIAESRHAGAIDVREGPALGTVAGLDGPFDLVFIDADKEGYVAYYEAVVPRLAPRGLIVADNVLWSGRVAHPDVDDAATRAIRAFNDHVAADPRTIQVMLTLRDGVTLIGLAPVT
ncbi:MAG: O-methyltransferase [Acidimicrobiales bacterium]